MLALGRLSFWRTAAALSVLCLAGELSAHAACSACSTFGPAVAWGTVSLSALTEASGIAASQRNAGVVWVHNDGSRQLVYALSTNGTRLATFDFNQSVDDTEDIAIGPGPVAGQPYLYVGDIGGNAGTNTVRSAIKIIRIPEPVVDLSWADNPRSPNFDGVETFMLKYPDGSYDAETLMVDPISGDVLVVTKQDSFGRLYRANLTSLPNQSTVTMQFVRTVSFSVASGGDISIDGTQIVLRRENFAMSWGRCTNETVGDALARAGQSIPVVGPPTEPNGEAIALLPDGTGYVTISEGQNPVLYFFQARCPAAPEFTLSPSDVSVFSGGRAEFQSYAVGYPMPTYQWSFNGAAIAGQTSSILVLTNVALAKAGPYKVVASNAYGKATNTATLVVRPKPDLRITEAMPKEASSPGVPTGDWWELTSFESQTVDLSGWRFNDNTGGLTDPFVLGAGTMITPGESVVFVEDLTPAQFLAWWGATNLPIGLQIITYTGTGLSLGATGDGLRLWNAQTSDTNDTMASVDFGAADTGVSFNYDPITKVFGGKSQIGVNGVIRAASSVDIGSPGRIRALAVSPSIRCSIVGNTVRVEFNTTVGYQYSLQTRGDFETATWELTGDTFQATNNLTGVFTKEITGTRRFLRLQVQ